MTRRLFAWLAAAALASAALTCAVALVLSARAADHQVLRNLSRQADAATLALDASAAPRRARLRVFALAGAGGPRRRRAPGVAAAIARAGAAQGRVRVRGRELAYVRRDSAAGPVAFVRPARPAAGDTAPVGRILLLSGLGAAIVAAALAALVAGRLTRPLRRLRAATVPLAAGRPGVRVPVEGDDEVAALGRDFNAMADALERARDAERAFLMAVTHELRTPLTSVRGYAEALEDGVVEPAAAGATIGAEAARLQRLVGDLLELAELRARAFRVHEETVDLAEAGAAAVTRHAAAARAGQIDLRSGGAGTARGDRDRLVQAVSNLVENAVRVTPAGGAVRVQAAPGRIEVLDSGPGLEPADLERAFERFHLHRRYGAERGGGSGLGLAIVAELAEAMGGRATARRRPEGGTAFAIELSDGAAASSP